MALETTLSKIEAYNSLISIPQSGLLGIGGFRAKPRSTEQVENLLKRCIELSELGEEAIRGAAEAKRKNVHLYSAVRQVFPTEQDQRELLEILEQSKRTCQAMLNHLRGQLNEASTEADLDQLVRRLRNMSGRIKEAMPRDAYLASLTGATFPNLAGVR